MLRFEITLLLRTSQKKILHVIIRYGKNLSVSFCCTTFFFQPIYVKINSAGTQRFNNRIVILGNGDWRAGITKLHLN